MAVVNQVEKKIRMDQWDIVKFQLTVHCYIKRIKVSDHDLSCLTLLGIVGEQTIESLCKLVVSNEIFSSLQSARNVLSKAEKVGLVARSAINKRKVLLNPSLNIQTSGNILVNLRVVRIEPTAVTEGAYESQESERATA
jgi:hypothetical protein